VVVGTQTVERCTDNVNLASVAKTLFLENWPTGCGSQIQEIYLTNPAFSFYIVLLSVSIFTCQRHKSQDLSPKGA
jgi:hypothetical protein